MSLLQASLKLQRTVEHFCSVFVSVLRAKLLKIVTKLVKTLKGLIKVCLDAALVKDLYLQGKSGYCGVWWKRYSRETPACSSVVLTCPAKYIPGTI